MILEIDLLHEQGQEPADGEMVRAGVAGALELAVAQTSFDAVGRAAGRLRWTRDPWDRLIVANAIADGARLLTADARILEHFADAVW